MDDKNRINKYLDDSPKIRKDFGYKIYSSHENKKRKNNLILQNNFVKRFAVITLSLMLLCIFTVTIISLNKNDNNYVDASEVADNISAEYFEKEFLIKEQNNQVEWNTSFEQLLTDIKLGETDLCELTFEDEKPYFFCGYLNKEIMEELEKAGYDENTEFSKIYKLYELVNENKISKEDGKIKWVFSKSEDEIKQIRDMELFTILGCKDVVISDNSLFNYNNSKTKKLYFEYKNYSIKNNKLVSKTLYEYSYANNIGAYEVFVNATSENRYFNSLINRHSKDIASMKIEDNTLTTNIETAELNFKYGSLLDNGNVVTNIIENNNISEITFNNTEFKNYIKNIIYKLGTDKDIQLIHSYIDRADDIELYNSTEPDEYTYACCPPFKKITPLKDIISNLQLNRNAYIFSRKNNCYYVGYADEETYNIIKEAYDATNYYPRMGGGYTKMFTIYKSLLEQGILTNDANVKWYNFGLNEKIPEEIDGLKIFSVNISYTITINKNALNNEQIDFTYDFLTDVSYKITKYYANVTIDYETTEGKMYSFLGVGYKYSKEEIEQLTDKEINMFIVDLISGENYEVLQNGNLKRTYYMLQYDDYKIFSTEYEEKLLNTILSKEEKSIELLARREYDIKLDPDTGEIFSVIVEVVYEEKVYVHMSDSYTFDYGKFIDLLNQEIINN